jgi:DNA replication initiation complex subunit (GINS family)
MKKMQTINLNTIPDEFYNEVKETINQMEELFKMKENEVLKEYVKIREQNSTTRDLVETIKQSPLSKILFAIHSKKPYDILIWKLL